MARAVFATAILAFTCCTGCGSAAANLFVVTRAANIPAGHLRLRVTDDGRASCDGAPLVEITSAQLITARQARRDLDALGSRRLAAGRQSVFTYRVRTERSTVAWADDSARQPPVLFRLAKLVRDIARGPCHLPR
jgi:hypothetical protein